MLRNFVAIIVSSSYFPGIDVEFTSSRVGRIKHKFLTSKELEWCVDTDIQTACWSTKESIFKIYERELDFHDIEVCKFNIDDDSGKFKASVIKKHKECDFIVN